MKDRNHVSEEEIKKRIIIFVLIGILVAIVIIIVRMFFPKGKNGEPPAPAVQPQATGTGSVAEQEQTNKVNKNTISNKISNSTENSSDLDIIAKDKNKVTISIKAGTLTVDGAVIVITDTNVSTYSWIPEYRLQQKIDDTWQDMELKNPENAFFPEIQTNNETGILEQSLVWVNKYGSLGTGQYRIVKESDGNEFYATFEVQ